ncbi:MAG: tRNA guanosine(15) transglycosylase TgtA [Promethearchaeota archaeon]|nr:MAG: tRNA guanosine(15) transglycosylase TgtA [Candidatus Lokiarchaeota archaeon]
MEKMKWEISDFDALGRIGKITVNEKQLITPNLFPVIHPSNNLISTSDLMKIGAKCVFTNAYIIYQNLQIRDIILRKGLQSHLNFDGIIATDSGAFQKYMYKKSKLDIQAEDIEKFQENIGTDFAVILDEPVQPDDDYETAKKKVDITIDRAKDNINRRINDTCFWFGPIHGAKFDDLLKRSTIEMSKLDFGVYAIGGLVKSLLNYRFDLVIRTLLTVKKNIIWNKPIHMFGLGLPQFFSLAIACGCDLMDSAAYVLFAKENRYFTLSTGTRKLEELEEFPCHCPICCKYDPKELLNLEDQLRTELLAKHNLYISFSELRTIRQAIKEGNLWELVEQRIRNHPNLVTASKLIKSYLPLIESHEKLYKTHGRLYSSPESVQRPLLYRYELKLKNNYRVPKNAKFLIILPELDVKREQSPSIKKWLEELDNNSIIPRELLHITFFSNFYGIIPLELSSSFPMGQHEAIMPLNVNGVIHLNLVQKIELFFKNFSKYYSKCGILIPENFINQFNEIVEFPKKNILKKLTKMLNSRFKLQIASSCDIISLIQYFKSDE